MAFLVCINYFVSKNSIYFVLKLLICWFGNKIVIYITLLVLKLIDFLSTKKRLYLNSYSTILRLVHIRGKIAPVNYVKLVLSMAI